MTLPAITLAIVTSVYAIRMLRDNLIEVLDADYIKMAQLKGLSIWQVTGGMLCLTHCCQP